jgi:hypothetical protein
MAIRTLMLTLMLSAALPAFALGPQQKAEFQALSTYCKADVERLCPNVQPGGGRIKECLMAQKESISVGCAKALQELKKSMK